MNSTVKKNMASLKDLNRSLMQKCQQKRDLLMVAVKYHYLCTQVLYACIYKSGVCLYTFDHYTCITGPV